MRKSTIVVIVVLLIIGLVVLRQTLYVVDVTEQVLLMRSGEVTETRIQPGLYWKSPFVFERVVKFDKRILRFDSPPVVMPDKEKQNLVIDSYVLYQITNPERFLKTLQSETGARSRLGDIVTSILRDEVALRDRFEIIGSRPILDGTGNLVKDEEGLFIFQGTETRSRLLQDVLAGVRYTVSEQNFGIEIIDAPIKRVNFTDSVAPSIYTRMRDERNRIATKLRAEGEEEARSIRAVADRNRDVILAEAQAEADKINSSTEARITDTLIQALSDNNKLSVYLDSLKAYKISRGLVSN